jgi:hypothetical protein
MVGIAAVVVVGSMRFSIDDRMLHKLRQIKQRLVHMAF